MNVLSKDLRQRILNYALTHPVRPVRDGVYTPLQRFVHVTTSFARKKRFGRGKYPVRLGSAPDSTRISQMNHRL